MQMQKMNARVKGILRELCRQEGYVTLAAIAATLGVSAKTVVREMSAVEAWLNAQGWQLEKKTGAGVCLDGGAIVRQQVRVAIAERIEVVAFAPQERQRQIIAELLRKRDVIKLYSLAVELKVTEGTVSNDLDKVESWLKEQNLTLVRKPGLGVYLAGAESDIRRATISFIHQTVGAELLLELIRNPIAVEGAGLQDFAQRRLLHLIEVEQIQQLQEMVRAAETELGGRLTDDAYVGLTVHLALSVQRIRQQEVIEIDPSVVQTIMKQREYSIAARLGQLLTEHFALEIPLDELAYIAMHLQGLKNRDGVNAAAQPTVGSFELVKVAKEIIREAEAVSGLFLGQNEKLLAGLVNHLGPALSRLRLQLEIRNPLLPEIKKFYPELMTISRKCIGPVERQWGVKLPEAEIAYIAMHLGAALEAGGRRSRIVYRAAVACPSGMGTSRLLASKIESEYDNIAVVDIVSSLHLDAQSLREKRIDFILATVPIADCELPLAVVNPLLFAADKKRIEELLGRMNGRTFESVDELRPARPLRDKLQQLHAYQQAMLQLLDHFFLLTATADSVPEMIETAAAHIVADAGKRRLLVQDLLRREAKGGTRISGHGFCLLHCRTAAVSGLHFGIIRLQQPLVGTESIDLAVIMLAPLQCDKHAMETISHLSQLLVERPAFTKILRRGDAQAADLAVSRRLEEWYRDKSKAVLES